MSYMHFRLFTERVEVGVDEWEEQFSVRRVYQSEDLQRVEWDDHAVLVVSDDLEDLAEQLEAMLAVVRKALDLSPITGGLDRLGTEVVGE